MNPTDSPKSSALGEHALAERVDVSVGRLPEAEDRLGRRAADERDVRRHGGHQARGRRRHRERPPHRARAARQLQSFQIEIDFGRDSLFRQNTRFISITLRESERALGRRVIAYGTP